VIIAGVTVFLTAILGVCLTRRKNRICLAFFYGIFAFFLGTAMIIFGIITVAAKSYITPQQFRTKVCATSEA